MTKMYYLSTVLVFEQEAKFSGLAPLKDEETIEKYRSEGRMLEMLDEGDDSDMVSFLDVIMGDNSMLKK
jgi:hypothetical protein